MTLEKDVFTNRRLDQLKENPDLIQTERWGEHCFIPLDIPRYDYPEVATWFFEKAKPIYKLKSDIANPDYGMTNFDSVDIFVTDKIEDHIWSTNPQQDFLKLFPDIVERIMEEFPLRSIRKFVLWSSTKNVRFHRDHTKFVDYPSSFRIMLYDENPIPTLSLEECLPDSESTMTNQFSVPKLSDTNSLVWNNLRVKHGSFFLPNFRKIILIIDWYELDVDRYHLLIEKSIEKYKNHLMISKRNIKDFINL